MVEVVDESADALDEAVCMIEFGERNSLANASCSFADEPCPVPLACAHTETQIDDMLDCSMLAFCLARPPDDTEWRNFHVARLADDEA